jgi:hypothetical protein
VVRAVVEISGVRGAALGERVLEPRLQHDRDALELSLAARNFAVRVPLMEFKSASRWVVFLVTPDVTLPPFATMRASSSPRVTEWVPVMQSTLPARAGGAMAGIEPAD